jgi:hypothetical protein
MIALTKKCKTDYIQGMLASMQLRLSIFHPAKNVQINIYKTINLYLVLYGCETSSLSLKDDEDLGSLRTGCLGEYVDLRGKK